jgi:hypothetical protein
MRVWVYPERSFEELGAERWQVSWQTLRKSAEGKPEIDHDADVIDRFENFKKKEDAMEKANQLVKDGVPFYGCVGVQRQVVDWFVEEDRVAEWVNAGQSEEVA